MNLRIWICFINLAFVNPVWGQEDNLSLQADLSAKRIVGLGRDWQVSRRIDNQRVSLVFKGQALPGARSREYRPVVPSSLLNSSEVMSWKGKEYLVTVWQEGVQASALRIFDPTNKDKLLVFEAFSIGSIDYQADLDGLKIEVYKNSNEPMSGVRETQVWKAGSP